MGSSSGDSSMVWVMTSSLAAAKAAQALHSGGYFANYLDLTREYTGVLAGLGNTIATLAGVMMPHYAAWTVEWTGGSYQLALLTLVAADVVVTIIIGFGMSVDCLD